MKNALLKIKEQLDSSISYLATKSAVEKAIYITTGRNVPNITDFPAIALKDGAIAYNLAGVPITAGADLEAVMRVRVTAFINLYREEDIITGNDNEKGIIDLADDIKAALNGYNPDEVNGSPFIIETEAESQVMVDDEGQVYIQTKELVFKRFTQVTI